MKRLAFALALLLCLATVASAQKRTDIFENFDLDSTSEVFCDTGQASLPEGMTQCTTGTADEDGWVDARTEDFKGVVIIIDAMALTSGTIDVRIYGRVKDGTTATELGTVRTFAAADQQYVVVPEALRQIRVSYRINGTDDGDGSPEDVSLYYYGSRRLR